MALDLRSSELEHSFIKERISSIDKHFSEISAKLSAYLKKLAHVRDSGDDFAKSILNFASKENLNLSLRNSLMQFADTISTIQEYRDTQVQRIDVKVVLEFSNYNHICKKAKTDLKSRFDIRSKELSKKSQLEKTRGKNPTDWQKIAQAEKEASQAENEATRATDELSRTLDNFEQQKLNDVKNAFFKFIQIELSFHAKAVELYTKAYSMIKDIQVEEDLKEFRNHFRAYSYHQEMEYQPDTETQVKTLNVAAQVLDMNKTSELSPNASSISCRSGDRSRTSIHTPNTGVKTMLSKISRKSIKPDQSKTFSTAKIDNSASSLGGSLNESRFEFGDHCL